MSTILHEFTGFQVDTDSGVLFVPFGIQADARSGVYADWVIPPITNETHIPGTNFTYVETLGHGLARTSWTLDFADKRDYNTFLSLLGATGTLRVLAGFQSLKGTTPVWHNPADHRDYEDLDFVRLANLSASHQVGGYTEAVATFTRAVDPVTRLAEVLT